jgi:hypothetical protein
VGSIQNELNDFLLKPTRNHVSANECDSGTNYLLWPRYHCTMYSWCVLFAGTLFAVFSRFLMGQEKKTVTWYWAAARNVHNFFHKLFKFHTTIWISDFNIPMRIKHKPAYYGISSFPVFENSGKMANGYIFQIVKWFSRNDFRFVSHKVINIVGGTARETT